MFKEYATIPAIIGFAALGLAATASANYPSSYPDSNYYSKAPIPIASASSYAQDLSDSGFVIGIEGGYADTHWDNLDGLFAASFSGTGFTARGFLGYEFNKYLGLEAGYIYLPNADLDGTGDDITNYAIDFLGKLSVPVTSGLDLFAKAGVGYLKSSGSGTLSAIDASNVGPAFGVGAGYEVVPNLAVNLSWMRYSGNGKIADADYQPSPDAVLLGMSYKWPMSNS